MMPFVSFSKLEIGQIFHHTEFEWVKTGYIAATSDNPAFNAYKTLRRNTHRPIPEQTLQIGVFNEQTLVKIGIVPKFAPWGAKVVRNEN